MRANEFISELFDGGKDWKWSYQDKNQVSAAFSVGDVHYTFTAVQDPDEAPGDWDVDFAAKQANGMASWGVTGTGNAPQVLGTVVDIIKAFITSKKASIRRMTFAAKEDSRQGLYARMVKRLLPKWNLEQNEEAFVLTRPGGLVFWVYSVEAPYNKIPAVKVKANSAKEAEQIVLTTSLKFKGADLMGMKASKNKPNLSENFADGRNPQDKGDSKRQVIGPFKLISVNNGVVTVEGHEPLRLSASVRDSLRPGYNYAFDIVNGEVAKVILMVVDAVIYTDTEVLLIKRKGEPYAGHWALPGGFVEPGETAADAAKRELQEETGLVVNNVQPVGEFKTPNRDPRMENTWSYAFKLHLPNRGVVHAGDDASAASWIPIKQLSTLQLAFDHSAILARALK